MMGLLDGERILIICSAVLIQSTSVTDGRTDGIAVAYTRYSVHVYVVARKNANHFNLHYFRMPPCYTHETEIVCRSMVSLTCDQDSIAGGTMSANCKQTSFQT